MSDRKDVVERYFDGFRRSDHQAILELLTEDVVWDLAGFRHLQGKEAFPPPSQRLSGAEAMT